MINVDFRKRHSLPEGDLTPGTFYWVERERTELWFVNENCELIPINEDFSTNEIINKLMSELDTANSDIESLSDMLETFREEMLGNIEDINIKVALKDDLDDYAKKEDIPDDYLTDSDLDDYAKKEDIPDDYLTGDDLEGYARMEDIPDDYLTDSDLDDYVRREDVNEELLSGKFKTINGETIIGEGEIKITAEIELTPEQLDAISEKVEIKPLTWKQL